MPSVRIYPDKTRTTFLSTQAQEFREAYQISNSKGHPSRTKQKNLIVEEFKEFLEADAMLFRENPKIHADCLKEVADLVYVCHQYAENMGWDLDRAMDKVNESNMSKLDEYGRPIFREDGKVLKGPNYTPPNLEELV